MRGKGDCEKRMNAVIPVAERMLSECREFYPYGGYMKPDGEIFHVGAKDQDGDHPKSKELIYLLRRLFVDLAATGSCKATAIVFGVHIAPPG